MGIEWDSGQPPLHNSLFLLKRWRSSGINVSQAINYKSHYSAEKHTSLSLCLSVLQSVIKLYHHSSSLLHPTCTQLSRCLLVTTLAEDFISHFCVRLFELLVHLTYVYSSAKYSLYYIFQLDALCIESAKQLRGGEGVNSTAAAYYKYSSYLNKEIGSPCFLLLSMLCSPTLLS